MDVLSRLKTLPQAAVIKGGDAMTWVEHMERTDPERIGWHAARAAGIGGSEAGTVLAWYTGETKSRRSVVSLVRDKLLQRVPDTANPDMMRGTLLEEQIRVTFEARLTREGRRWTRRADMEALVNSTVPELYPWMRANVDGIYEIDGATVIVDFKAPTENSLRALLRVDGSDEYKAQLNHYHIVADAADVRVHALWLVPYDYNRLATDGVQVINVPIDPLMQQALVKGEKELWKSCVMQGIVPEHVTRRAVHSAEDVPEHVQDAASQAARAKLIEEAASRVYEDKRQVVSDWVSGHGHIGDMPLFVGQLMEGEPGVMRTTAVRKLNMDAALERLSELGVDDVQMDELRTLPSYKDIDVLGRAYDRLREAATQVAVSLSNGDALDPKALQRLIKVLSKVPAQHEGEMDPLLVEKQLVACKENPYDYHKETVRVVLSREGRFDIDAAATRAEEEVASLISRELMSSEADETPEMSGEAGVQLF